jgi:hypothetical protein
VQVTPASAAPAVTVQARPEQRPDPGAGLPAPVQSDDSYVHVEVMNGAVSVGGPPPVLPLHHVDPPQGLPPSPLPVPKVESAALVGPLSG